MISGISTAVDVRLDPFARAQESGVREEGNTAAGALAGNMFPVESVSVKAPDLLTDEEAQEMLAETRQEVVDNPLEALSLHQGLDYNRVMALLADVDV